MKLEDKITEQSSHYDHLEQMEVGDVLRAINQEDRLVAEAVEHALPKIEALVILNQECGVVDDYFMWVQVLVDV